MKKYSLSVKLEKKHLLLPISNGAEMVCINVNIGGQNVREFDAELATTKEQISFWSFLDVTEFQGEEAVLQLEGATE